MRAVEPLRLMMGEILVADVRAQVALSLSTDFENYTTFRPAPSHQKSVKTMLDQVIAWGGALKVLRKDSHRRARHTASRATINVLRGGSRCCCPTGKEDNFRRAGALPRGLKICGRYRHTSGRGAGPRRIESWYRLIPHHMRRRPMRNASRALLCLALGLSVTLPALAAGSRDIESTPQAKVYRENARAIAAADSVRYKKTMSSASLKQMEEQEKGMKKTDKEIMEFMKKISPTDVKLTDLKVDGKKATLSMTGKSDGAAMKGSVEMVEENRQWKIDQQEWSNAK